MEVTLTELALLVWAFVATSLWLDARSNAKMAQHILRVFITDADARGKMVAEYEKFEKKVRAQ